MKKKILHGFLILMLIYFSQVFFRLEWSMEDFLCSFSGSFLGIPHSTYLKGLLGTLTLCAMISAFGSAAFFIAGLIQESINKQEEEEK